MNIRNVLRGIAALLVGLLGFVLALPAALLVLPFRFVELLANGLQRILEPPSVPWEELIEFSPEVGWKPRGGVSARALDFNGDAYQVTTDPSGWRGNGTVEDSDVVVFGDSYAFGCGVDDDAFFADLATGVRIKSIGSPAYSMVHSLLWLERTAPSLSGKLVVWLIYPGNDLADNTDPAFLAYRSPFVRPTGDSGDWEIVSRHVTPEKWTIDSREGEMRAYVKICSPTLQSERAFQACDYLIRRADAVCREAGAELVVMSIPDLSLVAKLALDKALSELGDDSDFDPDLPNRRLGQTCERLGLRFVALSEHLTPEDYLERDFHWSPSGHRRLAALISTLAVERESPERMIS